MMKRKERQIKRSIYTGILKGLKLYHKSEHKTLTEFLNDNMLRKNTFVASMLTPYEIKALESGKYNIRRYGSNIVKDRLKEKIEEYIQKDKIEENKNFVSELDTMFEDREDI